MRFLIDLILGAFELVVSTLLAVAVGLALISGVNWLLELFFPFLR